jgi:hypothetical protein
MVILVVACAVAPLHFDGHVLCSLANGTAEVPVENAEVKLLEEDSWFFPPRHDILTQP